MTPAKKRLVIIVSIIVAVLIILFFVFEATGLHFQSPVVFLSPSQHAITSGSVQPIPDTKSNAPFATLQEISDGGAIEQMSYQEASQLYKDSHLIFNPNCRVTPVALAVPTKGIIMLDNQSKWQRSIIVGPHHYTMMPYSYILASFDIPGAYGITCDSVQDVGFISVG